MKYRCSFLLLVMLPVIGLCQRISYSEPEPQDARTLDFEIIGKFSRGKATQQWSSGHAHLARWLLPLQGGGRLAPTDADRRLWYLIGARLAWALFFSVLVMALVMALG